MRSGPAERVCDPPRRAPRLAVLLPGIFASAVSLGQPATLVKDIYPGASPQPTYFNHSDLVPSGNFLFFTSDAGGSGNELWRTDGTAAGTILLGALTTGSSPASEPSNLTDVNGTLFFVDGEFYTGRGLWKTDGTVAGTVLVRRFNSYEFLQAFQNVNGTLFFFKNDELWKSDGTPIGTVLVRAGFALADPVSLASFGGELFFSADGGFDGSELWKSDGTASGTVLVRDINPSGSSSPMNLTVVGSTLFFSAYEPTHGRELWKSDGSEGGTVLVKDIQPGSGSSNPAGLTAFGSQLLFAADDGSSGYEPWATDGTGSGTSLLRDIRSGSASSFSYGFAAGTTEAFFVADDGYTGQELWKTDGTPTGTVRVADIFVGPGSSNPAEFHFFNGTLYFRAYDSMHLSELWKSDGSPSGTAPVKDIYVNSPIVDVNGALVFWASDDGFDALWKSDGTGPGTSAFDKFLVTAGSSPGILTANGSEVVFVASNAADGQQIWETDGSPSGTRMVTAFDRTLNSFSPVEMRVSGGRTFFTSDGFLWVTPGATSTVERLVAASYSAKLSDFSGTLLFSACGTPGCGLWKSDGTVSGTQFVKAFPAGAEMRWPAVPAGGVAYFVLDNLSPSDQLWKTDGTPAGTGLVATLPSFDGAHDLVAFQNLLYLVVDAFPSATIWKSDGTAAGTQSVIALAASQLRVVNGTLFFTAAQPTTGLELWRTDGTSGGTHLVKDINPGTQDSNPRQLVGLNNVLYFVADDGTHGAELWRSDGTDTGTSLVLDIRAGAESPTIQNLTAAGNLVFFSASDFSTGTELWESDGTPGGTKLVKDINPGAASSSPDSLTDAAGTLYFAAYNDSYGRELWKSDGTQSGTVLVRDIEPGLNGSAPNAAAEVAGTLYFSARTAENGFELWKSDGTGSGTSLVKDLIPGPYSGSPYGMTPYRGGFLFAGADETRGVELWWSDGTESGTFLLKDINPGPASSRPNQLVAFGGKVFFNADDGTPGEQLWVTDGTPEGTVRFQAISDPFPLVVSRGYLFFVANTPDGFGRAVWRTDGTPSGTIQLTEVPWGTALLAFSGGVFFSKSDSGGGSLWKSDGTPAGTVEIETFSLNLLAVSGGRLYGMRFSTGAVWELWVTNGTAGSALLLKSGFVGNAPPFPVTDVNGIFFFSADDGTHGRELWKSDGTVSGTVLVKDIQPGPLGSVPGNFLNVGGKLLFRAHDPLHGSELWVSDGTSPGTQLLQDINPGPSSSQPGNLTGPASGYGLPGLTIAGTRIFFPATDLAAGCELWSMPMSAICTPPPAPTVISSKNPSCGNAVILDAGPGYAAYLWSTGETTRTITVAPKVTTTYTVYVSNAAGCRSSAAFVQMVDPSLVPPPPVASNSGPACAGESVQLTASSVPGGVYAWTGPNGFMSAQQNPLIGSVTAAAAGTYTVTVTVGGCVSPPAATLLEVKPKPSPPRARNSGAACGGESVQLKATSVPGGTYAWTGPNGYSSSEQNPVIASATTAASGAYSVTVTVDGCVSLPATTVVSVGSCQVRPVGLGMDGTGNGVLEPGETVALSPSWENTTGTGLPEAGTATAFTGPAGATYVITDAGADYGTIGAGAVASCAGTGNCYGGMVSDPAVRPQLHWDTVFTESVSTGESKGWSVHVGESFSDVPASHPFYRFVETLLHGGVTVGCGSVQYCPDATVTRAQASVFLLRSAEGRAYMPPAAVGVFGDVPVSSPYARWIEELARRGITAGCGGGNFCPGTAVTRAQVSVFLLASSEGAGYLPPTALGTFGDVPVSSPYARWIEELARRGITAGCAPGLYCPDNPVTRGQIAVFLTTTFGLKLYGP